jgi:dTDP-N-acetylfucosamine:lipid II N-acetylfucosaminyltransferase
MYLHLMTDSPFIDKIVRQCDEISNQNRYVVFGKKIKYAKPGHVEIFDSYKTFRKRTGFDIHAYKRIFIHYLGGNSVDLILEFPEYKEYYWFFWGADGYSLISDSKNIYLPKTRLIGKQKKPLKLVVKSYLQKWLRPSKEKKLKAVQHIKRCCTWVKEDFDLICSCTRTPLQFQFFSYLSTDELFSKKEQVEGLPFNASGGELRILAGNSLNPTNNHIEMIEYLLAIASGEQISVTMPLSYGGLESYKKQLIQFVSSRFPMVNVLDKFLPYDEYMEIFKSIDVAVFFHIRQQGANNALALLWLGKILIMREENTLFMTLRSWGLSVLSHAEVRSLDYLRQYHEKNLNRVETNRQILLNHISPEAVKDYYRALYD